VGDTQERAGLRRAWASHGAMTYVVSRASGVGSRAQLGLKVNHFVFECKSCNRTKTKFGVKFARDGILNFKTKIQCFINKFR
jgi:hypothetical protein